MNQAFAEHTTNTAFFLSMSKNQIALLMAIVEYPWTEADAHSCYSQGAYLSVVSQMRDPVTAMDSLVRKGLAERVSHKMICFRGQEHDHRHGVATKAGTIVVELLKEAGFTATSCMFTKQRSCA